MAPLMHTTFIKKRRFILSIGAVSGFLLLFLFLYFSIHMFYAPDELEQIQEKGVLRIALDSSDLGYNAESQNGFAYEIACAVADSLGVAIEIVVANGIDNQIDLLKRRKVHAVFMPTPKTLSYNFHLSYSSPLFLSRYVLAQSLQDSLLVTHAQLEGKTVVISDNAPARLCLVHLSEALARDIAILNIASLTEQELVAMVAANEVPRTLVSSVNAKRWQLLYPTVDFSLVVGFYQHYSFVSSGQSNEWADYLNHFIESYINSPAYGALFQRYYNAVQVGSVL